MKKRYYLRGLGLGILFTALFFMVGGKSSEQAMSDEMIIERAKELGMIENTVLADLNGSTGVAEADASEVESPVEETAEMATADVTETEETVEVTTEAVTETEETVVEITTSEETSLEEDTSEEIQSSAEETTVEESEALLEEETSEEAEENVVAGQMISIIVNKGEGSDTVSHRLHEAGLIDDPYEFDRYLMQNGYDKRIGAGEHLIPVGADWQEIAKIITS